jgi:hypothetical protein
VRQSKCRRPGALLAVVLFAASVSGCSIYSGNSTQKVREWVMKSAFIADINTVLSDVSRIHRAMETGTPKELRTICSGLADDVGTTYESLPAPSAKLTTAINVPVQVMFAASNSCSVASSVDSTRTEHAFSQLERAESELKHVQSLLATFGVRWRAHL